MAKKSSTNASPIPVMKTYKLYIGGAFPRTESGRYYPLRNKGGELIANVCLSSRKDFRNAVVAARKAQAGWAERTAYNRSQIVYRIAEMLQQRKATFLSELVILGYTEKQAKEEFDSSLDYLVYFSGWCDKYSQLFSTVNPVASAHFNFSVPEPMGVIAAFASPEKGLLGVLEAFVPAICGGNAVVLLASESFPTSAITLAEVLAVSDLPGGVVNILTGKREELLSHFASHMDVNALHLWDVDSTDEKIAGQTAAENVKRVKSYQSGNDAVFSPYRILDCQEIKTTWHPIEVITGSGSSY